MEVEGCTPCSTRVSVKEIVRLYSLLISSYILLYLIISSYIFLYAPSGTVVLLKTLTAKVSNIY